MKHIMLFALYMSLSAGANAAYADSADISALRSGDMKKLVVHSTPLKTPETGFISENGDVASLPDYRGKVVLVNFWATWCAPCRKEMPEISKLQSILKSGDFEVLTIAVGRNTLPAMQRFLKQINVDNLPLHTDPRMQLSRAIGVFGLPVTVILDRSGREVARLQGDADWSSESAIGIITALIEA
ncbi:MAG: TlpA disulfide reductase family protein [Roseovarius sp.]|nr:TlpA disulfide reductase family protein [Roseovarius sp.]